MTWAVVPAAGRGMRFGGAVPKHGDADALWEEEDRLYEARNARR